MKVFYTILSFICCCSLFGNPDSTAWEIYKDVEFQRIDIANKEAFNVKANQTVIREAKNGILWIGVRSERLFRFNGYEVFDVNEYINERQDSILYDAKLSTFGIDEDENIWLATNKGLFWIQTPDLRCESIFLDSTLLKEKNGAWITNLQERGDTLFVTSQNTLFLLDKKKKKLLNNYSLEPWYKADFNSGSSNGIRGIYFDQLPERIWLSIKGHFCALDLSSGEYTLYPEYPFMNQRPLFRQGFLVNDSLIFSASNGLGLVEFNITNKNISRALISTKDTSIDVNSVYSLIAVNDSIAMLSALNWGTGFYNIYTDDYHWLKVPMVLRFGHHGLNKDQNGYVWSGLGLDLYRTNLAFSTAKTASKPIIDISSIVVNNVQRGIPFLENYPVYQLKEYERSVELIFSLSQPHLYDEVLFEYQLNSKQWQQLDDAHHLMVNELTKGRNKLRLRAQVNGETITERELILEVYFPFYKSFWFYLSITVLLLGFGAGFIRYKIAQVRKEERLRADFAKKLAETESMALRSQINPHFIFNTLNSIKYYAVAKSPTETGEFISCFSALIRQVLENSKQHLIPLREELSMLNNYIEVEKMRFRNAFESSIKVDPAIDQDFFLIPPSLLQPFVENSIWHGLMHKEGEKKLEVIFNQEENSIYCQIIDNGIGREAAAKINKSKTAKSSLGMQITKDRIEHLKTLYGIESRIEIIDLYDEAGSASGTQVQISFSI